MANLDRQEIIDRTLEIYHPQQNVQEIDIEQARTLGQRLREVGVMIGGIALKNGTDCTVERLQGQSEANGRDFTIPGPFYSVHNEDTSEQTEFCVPGVGIWRVYEQDPFGWTGK